MAFWLYFSKLYSEFESEEEEDLLPGSLNSTKLQISVSLRMIKEVRQGIVYHPALRKTRRFKAICI